MMSNLFSVFDPSTSLFNLSLNWLSTFIGIFLIPCLYWFNPTRYIMIWYQLIMKLHLEFKILMNSSFKGFTLMFISMFSIILLNNLLGLFPYIFTSTSHLVMTLSLAFPIWLSFILFGWFMNTWYMLIHLVPQGTPSMLMSFMVLIESISNLIRSGTLAVRLSANMIAGHLLMSLLGNMGDHLDGLIIILLLIIQIMLLMLEVAVAIIQSYVFTILSVLYSSELK